MAKLELHAANKTYCHCINPIWTRDR